jgi:hypothetical protein
MLSEAAMMEDLSEIASGMQTFTISIFKLRAMRDHLT